MNPRVKILSGLLSFSKYLPGLGRGYFKLEKFQKDFIKDIYGKVDKDEKRIVRRAILSMGRKNGKTMLTAALALVHLIGPERILHSEIYSCANDRDQASIVSVMPHNL